MTTRSRFPRAWGAALVWAAVACSNAPQAPKNPPTTDRTTARDAVVPDAAPLLPRLDEIRGMPSPSGDVLWGVSIPAGCVAYKARRFRIHFKCYPSRGGLEQYFRYRFPAATIEVQGRAFRVDPGGTHGGYARVMPFVEGISQARMTVYRGNYIGTDPHAMELLRRISPSSRTSARSPER